MNGIEYQTIWLNLAGRRYQFGYNVKANSMVLDYNGRWLTVGEEGITLSCGQQVSRANLFLTIQSKIAKLN